MDAAVRYLRGAWLLAEGVRRYARTPRLLLLGLVPAVLTALLFAAGLVVLLYVIDDLAAAATWFADGWADRARTLVRVLAGIAILGLSGLVGVLAYTAVTLLVGDPFYERISREVEAGLGDPPQEVPVGFWREVWTSVADAIRLLSVTVLVGVPLFLAGFLPLVGQTVVPVAGATVGGWFLALELVGAPFERRGLRLADRRRALRTHRPEALGFGTAVFLCFLVPGGAVLLMPAAVVGGTLLARQVLAPSTSADGQGRSG
jgi:CysZ protein